MNIRELIDKLVEYPDTMEVVVIAGKFVWKKKNRIKIQEITEDPEVPNTVIIKI